MSQLKGGRPWYKRVGYQICRSTMACLFFICFGFRSVHWRRIPRTGGALLCANHSSHLDPVIGGISTNRAMNFLAKKELFNYPLFSPLIRFLDAIPIDRTGMGAGAIKELLKRLKRAELVLIFPEGTRSPDGNIGVVKSGFAALARRTGVPVVPMGIEGAYRVWPRERSFPLPGPRIRVVVGEPIAPAEYEKLSDEQFRELLENRIKDCIREARRLLKWRESEIERGLQRPAGAPALDEQELAESSN